MDSSEPAAASLARILTLLYHPWVKDFIFPETNHPDLLHLAIVAANSSPHPSTGVMNIATLPTIAQALSSDQSLDESMHVLFVPSFTTGDITVGFQVFERVKTNTVNTTRFYLARTVRDDANGMFLSVAEHPSLGTYEVSYGAQASACAREHVLMQFQSGPFLRAIKSFPMDEKGLRQALMYSFYSVEQKACGLCPVDGICQCRIATRPKRHMNDFDMENENMNSYCGDFDGMASVGSFWNGCKVFGGEVCSRVASRIVRDDGLGRRLAQWGMREVSRVRGIRINRLEIHPVVRAGIFARRETTVVDGDLLDRILNCGDDDIVGGCAMLPLLKDDDDSKGEDSESFARGVPIAPAGVVVENDRPLGMDEESWKKELKKRRNRAAAHRSNERKKRELEIMKRELTEFGRREKVLREREEHLRLENRRLRQEVLGNL